jgi:multiple sugar transport system substrate-binding protein
MKKLLLWLIVLLISISIISAFSLTSCMEPAEEPAEEAEPAEEEPAAEEPAEEAEPAEEKARIELHAWMYAEEEAGGVAVLNQAKEKFEAANPNVEVGLVALPYEATLEQLTIKASAGEQPDMTLIDVAWLAQVAAMGATEPLDEYISTDLKEKFYPATLEEVTVDGKIQALVWNDNPNGLCYNKTLMSQAGLDPNSPPKDMDELNDMIAKISDLGADIYGIGINNSIDSLSVDYFHPWLWNYGGEILDESGNVVINNEGSADAVEWLKDLIDQGYAQPGLYIREIRVLFAQNKCGFMVEGPWITGILRTESGKGEAFDEEWGATPMPKGPAVDIDQGYNHPSSHVIVLSPDSPNKDAAFKFMEFLVSDPEITSAWYDNTGMFPSVKNLLEEEKYKDEFVQTFVKAMEATRVPNAWGASYPEIAEKVATSLQEVTLNAADVKETLDTLALEVEGILGK